jgi:EAL domain-containing protein (putative c-di-GMP-specific phosphodiesterase class I)
LPTRPARIATISEHQLDKKGLSLEVNLSGLAFNDAELLNEYGVDYAQGYHVGRPGPWGTCFKEG